MGYKSIGRQLQLAREEAGYSQEQLAAKIGCSQSTLSNYEKGKRRIYLAQLEKIAEILNKPIEYFLRPADYHRGEPESQSGEPGNQSSPAPKKKDTSYQANLLPILNMPGEDQGEKTALEQNLLRLFQSLSPAGQILVINFVTWLKEREVGCNGEF
ncbi:helix-turn-helix domain-containing protein [Desulfallas sp. Bu1-1]|uniref:helix-turn-helix domain-containing protein n=1 Tax=Desulfallas sp. Bu1-1 TaxID=2787620 RepID=UPI00189DDBEC|nr:helix-turn-helix transcriptional regulator [Desulfallas sp. Bu1-1]MBF7084090.1 helix-turn-helix domain-containing protein [Desulfallas sp. Bu1-1]